MSQIEPSEVDLRIFDAHKKANGKQAKKEYEIRRHRALARKEPFLEEEPPQPRLFIPGNASTSAFMRALKDNGEIGIMVESEVDVLASAFKQDWGDFSHLLRQAFHHEPASSLRNGTHLFFERPALSIAISGTEGQVTTLLQSTEMDSLAGLCTIHSAQLLNGEMSPLMEQSPHWMTYLINSPGEPWRWLRQSKSIQKFGLISLRCSGSCLMSSVRSG